MKVNDNVAYAAMPKELKGRRNVSSATSRKPNGRFRSGHSRQNNVFSNLLSSAGSYINEYIEYRQHFSRCCWRSACDVSQSWDWILQVRCRGFWLRVSGKFHEKITFAHIKIGFITRPLIVDWKRIYSIPIRILSFRLCITCGLSGVLPSHISRPTVHEKTACYVNLVSLCVCWKMPKERTVRPVIFAKRLVFWHKVRIQMYAQRVWSNLQESRKRYRAYRLWERLGRCWLRPQDSGVQQIPNRSTEQWRQYVSLEYRCREATTVAHRSRSQFSISRHATNGNRW